MPQHYDNQSPPNFKVLTVKAHTIDLLAVYGAFGLIAAIVFGTVFSHSF